MIEVFKIMNGWGSVQESDFFRRDESGRRGHTYKLFKTGCDWIWPSLVSAIGYANSGTTCRVMLYHLPV